MGQRLNLSASMEGLPNGVDWSPLWELPESPVIVKDWELTDHSATRIDIETADFFRPNISFVWVVGGNNQPILCTIKTPDGFACTAEVIFDVSRPSYEFILTPGVAADKTTGGLITIDPPDADGDSILHYGDPLVASGGRPAGTPGILLSTNPPPPLYGNPPANTTLRIAQVITSIQRSIRSGNTWRYYAPTRGLDIAFPGNGDDSPGDAIHPADDEIQIADSFDVWLMYRPPIADAIFVPLKKLSWGWSATAVRQGGTVVLGAHAPAQASTGTDNYEFPEWTQIASPPHGHYVTAP